MTEPPPGQPPMHSSSCNCKTPDPQHVIIDDTAGATEPSPGAPRTKASKGKRCKTSAEKATEDAAAVSSAESSGFIQMQPRGQAVDPPGATLPPHKSILKVTWGDSEENQSAGPTPVTPPPPRDMSPLLHSTPQVVQGAPVEHTERAVAFGIKGHCNGSLKVETICERLPVYAMSSTDGARMYEVETRLTLKALAETSSSLKLQRGEVSCYVGDRKIQLGHGPKLLGEEPVKAVDQGVAGWIPVTVCEGNLNAMLTWEPEELEPLNLRLTQGEASNNAAPLAPLQHNEGLGLSNPQVGPSILEQTGMVMLPILHELLSPVGTQAIAALGEVGMTIPLQDHIRSEEDMMQENMENRVETNTQIKPPAQQEDGEGEGAYQATGGSKDNGPWSPQGLPLFQCPEEGETVGEYLKRRLHLARIEQIASKDVHAAHVASWWRVVQHDHAAMFDLGWQRPRAKNLFKVGTGEGQWSRHAISEQELAALLNLGLSTLSNYNSTMEEAMKVELLWMYEDPRNDLKLQYAELGVTAFKDKVSRRYKKLLLAQHAGDGLAEGDSSQESGDD
ncbi:hypothetical protein JB92DRAFT_3134808 [Gautieria morchelliformis]|nr:hypothetical protein JB92DRAFT_3134808 [Gautieria morchelliformis]